MDNRRQTNSTQSGTRQYVRQNSTAGVNPLCDRLRAQYSGRVGAAINRSEIRKAELQREAARNGWDCVRRPAPTYKVRSALRTYDPDEITETAERTAGPVPSGLDGDMKIYQPKSSRLERELAYASASGPEAVPEPQRSPGNVMTDSVTVKGRGVGTRTQGGSDRGFLANIGDILVGRNLARSDEKKVKKNDFPVGAIVAIVIVALLFMIVVYCSMQKFMIESEIAGLENQVSELSNVEKDLKFELEMREDLRDIEKYAVEKIGMVKKENVQTKYVNTVSEEKSRVISDEREGPDSVPAILSIFGSFIEYID